MEGESLNRILGVLVATTVGGLLAIMYEVILPMSSFDLESFVIFLTIPSITGFTLSYVAKKHIFADAPAVGLLVGATNGLAYLSVISFIEEAQITREEVPQLFFFVLMSILAWTLITTVAAYLASQMKE